MIVGIFAITGFYGILQLVRIRRERAFNSVFCRYIFLGHGNPHIYEIRSYTPHCRNRPKHRIERSVHDFRGVGFGIQYSFQVMCIYFLTEGFVILMSAQLSKRLQG
jgi:hypothetical protein